MFDHLEKNNLGYIEHFFRAAKISGMLLLASVCCIIHSIFPFLFTDTASSICKKIYKES